MELVEKIKEWYPVFLILKWIPTIFRDPFKSNFRFF